MEVAKIQVGGTCACAYEKKTIRAGMVGVTVSFAFDEYWVGLNKIAVYRCGGVVRDEYLEGDTGTIPAEVLTKSGFDLEIGVYGTDAEKQIAIPTCWANLGVVRPGADPSGDPAADPSLPIWAQILAKLGNLADLSTEAKENLVAAINEALTKGGGEVDPEEVGRIVNEYLEKNPPAAYTLPIATETTLGGVKAAAATEEMTQPVGITEDGKLVTAPGQNSGGNANQGGISTRAANLLITILQNVTLYDTNQLENISALQTELLSGAGSGGEDNPDTVMYTVTNNLSKVSNSNPMTSIEENSAYSAVLTASDGYTLDGAIVTVTMNGVDITATAYTEGVVTIEAVTGNVVISASAVLDGVIYTLPAPVSNETGTTGTSYIVDTGINISDPTESKTITFSFTPNENCAASAGNFSVMLCSSGNGVVGAQNAVCCIVSFDGKNVQFRIRDSSGSNTTTDLLTGGALGDTWKCVWMYDASVKEYTYKVISVNTAGAATNVVTKTVDVSTWELEENAGTMIVGGWQKNNGAYAMTNTTVHDVTIYNGLLDDDAVAGYLAA